MKYRRILAIGDMHGHFTRLLSLFHKINFDPEQDFLILLGDYIDRGDENMRCFRWAMEMSEKKNVIALRGNHEQMMLYYYLLGGEEAGIWIPNGGGSTKRELEAWIKREPDALERSLKFIGQRPFYHQMFVDGKEYIFVHAGLKPGVSLEKQTDESLLWIREEFYNGYNGTAEVIVGHTPTPYLFPDRYTPIFLKNHITIIDTGSFLKRGKISCVDVLSGKFWQSDPD
ncbi:MAG: metallophosphoesterase [Selenomonadaceae bacterium]|nr:metallophosphoesterase [Selenomonadaceae bacterium]MBR1730730.1 metallophosphoesterase [Selenomonadaceae bacterium]